VYYLLRSCSSRISVSLRSCRATTTTTTTTTTTLCHKMHNTSQHYL